MLAAVQGMTGTSPLPIALYSCWCCLELSQIVSLTLFFGSTKVLVLFFNKHTYSNHQIILLRKKGFRARHEPAADDLPCPY